MTDLRDKSDKDLVKLFLDGNRAVFNEFVSRYKRSVYSIARKYTFSHEAADDISQEVFITLYTKAHMYNEHYPFSSWLYRIAVNKSINYLKKMKREQGHEYLDELQTDEKITGVPLRNPNPEKVTENQELAGELKSAIQKLKPRYRMVFTLAVIEGMSYKDIAGILNISIGTVMSRLNRARNKLKQDLQPYLTGKNRA